MGDKQSVEVTSKSSPSEGLEGLKTLYPELAEELIRAIDRIRKSEGSPLNDGLISEKRTAIYLGISLRTLINWRADNIVPHYKIRGRILYRRSEIDQALKNKYRRGNMGGLH